MGRILFYFISFFISTASLAQVGINTTTPNDNAILDIESADKGVLFPRLSLSATNMPTPLLSHQTGMIVFNIASAGSGTTRVTLGLYTNSGTGWLKLVTDNTAIGDLKHSFTTADHAGWFLLNGRNVTTLLANAQTNAIALGFALTLPNSNDRFLKGRTGAEVLGSNAGANTTTITQANLPNVNFTGTTSPDGEHTHSYVDRGNTTGGVTLSGLVLRAYNTQGNYNTGSAGVHAHTVTVSSGGSATPLPIIPASIVANVFIYLGE